MEEKLVLADEKECPKAQLDYGIQILTNLLF